MIFEWSPELIQQALSQLTQDQKNALELYSSLPPSVEPKEVRLKNHGFNGKTASDRYNKALEEVLAITGDPTLHVDGDRRQDTRSRPVEAPRRSIHRS